MTFRNKIIWMYLLMRTTHRQFIRLDDNSSIIFSATLYKTLIKKVNHFFWKKNSTYLVVLMMGLIYVIFYYYSYTYSAMSWQVHEGNRRAFYKLILHYLNIFVTVNVINLQLYAIPNGLWKWLNIDHIHRGSYIIPGS